MFTVYPTKLQLRVFESFWKELIITLGNFRKANNIAVIFSIINFYDVIKGMLNEKADLSNNNQH